MKKVFSVFLLVFLLLSGNQTAVAVQENKSQTFSIDSNTAESMKKEVLDLVNQERIKAGASVLGGNSLLSKAAEIRAKEIAKSFSHTRPDGTRCFTVLSEVGINSFSKRGENIAYNSGYSNSAKQVMIQWMDSPGHRANILDKAFQLVGIGLYVENGRYYWTQMFYAGSAIKGEKESDLPITPYPGTPFTDINFHWGKDAIKWAYENNLFSGVSETQFGPEQKMSRSMLATVLHRLAGTPAPVENGRFEDIKSGVYYEKAVNWAAENGIVSGTGAGRFSPGANITREQLAAMLYRYAKQNGTAEPTGNLAQFIDSNKISPFARDALSWAVGRRIISGKGNGRLDPSGFATRAEVASILQRFAG